MEAAADLSEFGMWIYQESEKRTAEALHRGDVVYVHQAGHGKFGAYRRGFDLFRKAFSHYRANVNTRWGTNWSEVERTTKKDLKRYNSWVNELIINFTPPDGVHDEALGYDPEFLSGLLEIQGEFLRRFPEAHAA